MLWKKSNRWRKRNIIWLKFINRQDFTVFVILKLFFFKIQDLHSIISVTCICSEKFTHFKSYTVRNWNTKQLFKPYANNVPSNSNLFNNTNDIQEVKELCCYNCCCKNSTFRFLKIWKDYPLSSMLLMMFIEAE